MAKMAKTNGGTWLNMKEPELFEKVRKEFSNRGLGGLPLASMVRIVLGEWVEGAGAKTPRGHGRDSVNTR